MLKDQNWCERALLLGGKKVYYQLSINHGAWNIHVCCMPRISCHSNHDGWKIVKLVRSVKICSTFSLFLSAVHQDQGKLYLYRLHKDIKGGDTSVAFLFSSPRLLTQLHPCWGEGKVCMKAYKVSSEFNNWICKGTICDFLLNKFSWGGMSD